MGVRQLGAEPALVGGDGGDGGDGEESDACVEAVPLEARGPQHAARATVTS